MFIDKVSLICKAGKGGDGLVSWRREKYIPKGGPYGGNGGDGGSVIFKVDNEINSLESFRNKKMITAKNGMQGGSANRHGRNGQNIIIKVPPGTLIKDANDPSIILFDLVKHGEQVVLCSGGKGGKGNSEFKTSINRAPNTATPGLPGEEKSVELELKLIADVGLVGFPSAGKSTLMAAITENKSVKIAPYHFTTLQPNIGALIRDHNDFVTPIFTMADIPGIINDAHKNKGLGLEFLRHIERTKMLLFILDASGMEGKMPHEAFLELKHELRLYKDGDLLSKSYSIVLTKVDKETSEQNIADFKNMFPDEENIHVISAVDNVGLQDLHDFLISKLNK